MEKVKNIFKGIVKLHKNVDLRWGGGRSMERTNINMSVFFFGGGRFLTYIFYSRWENKIIKLRNRDVRVTTNE